MDLSDILQLGLAAYSASKGDAGGAVGGLSGILGPIFSPSSSSTPSGRGGSDLLGSIFGGESPIKSPVSQESGILDSLGSMLGLGGGEGSPSGYTGPSVLPQVIGGLASSFRATPRAGASRAERDKANRYNMIAGILGAASTAYGKASDEAAKQRAIGDLGAILSGGVSPTNAQVDSSGTMEELPAAPPLTKAEQIRDWIKRNPGLATQGLAAIETDAKRQFDEANLASKRKFDEANLAAKLDIMKSQREMADNKLEFEKQKLADLVGSRASSQKIADAKLEVEKAKLERASLAKTEPSVTEQRQNLSQQIENIKSLYNNVNQKLIRSQQSGFQGLTEDAIKQKDALETSYIEEANRLDNELRSLNAKLKGIYPQANQNTSLPINQPMEGFSVEGVQIAPTSSDEIANTLRTLGIPENQIKESVDSYLRATKSTPTPTQDQQSQAVQVLATPTATPSPTPTVTPQSTFSAQDIQKITSAPVKAKEKSRETLLEKDRKLSEDKFYLELKKQNSEPFDKVLTKFSSANQDFSNIQNFVMSDDPSTQQQGVTALIASRDGSVVQIGELDRYMSTVFSKAEQLKNQAMSLLGRRASIPMELRKEIVRVAKQIRDTNVRAAIAADEAIIDVSMRQHSGDKRASAIKEYDNKFKSVADAVAELNVAKQFNLPAGARIMKVRRVNG